MPLSGGAPKARREQQIPGTDRTVVRGNPTQMRQMRCPGCQKMAQATQDAQGNSVATCSCGRIFKSRPM